MTCWYFWLRYRGPQSDSKWLKDLSKLEFVAGGAASAIFAPAEESLASARPLVRVGSAKVRETLGQGLECRCEEFAASASPQVRGLERICGDGKFGLVSQMRTRDRKCESAGVEAG